MEKKLEKLTSEQEAHLEVVKKEWIDLCDSCEPVNEKKSQLNLLTGCIKYLD